MKYTLSWQDFMRQPAQKALKESKGIHACKQKFIQEQNKLMWHDPMMLNEAASDAGVINNANAPYGGATSFITGHAAEKGTYTWTTGLTSAITSSGFAFHLEGHALTDGTSFTANHSDIRKKYALVFMTGSLSLNIADEIPGFDTSNFDLIVTASANNTNNVANYLGSNLSATGSFANLIVDAIATQAAGALVAGFTNTIAPSTLITALTGSVGATNLEITNVIKGGVNDLATDATALTGSVTTTQIGTDTFHDDKGSQIFDGQVLPFASMPRKDVNTK